MVSPSEIPLPLKRYLALNVSGNAPALAEKNSAVTTRILANSVELNWFIDRSLIEQQLFVNQLNAAIGD